MRFVAIASDYDGTLAENGRVDKRILGTLEAVRASGRHLILLTGRHLPDLLQVFPRAELFDRIIAENGALLYRPASREQKLLTDPVSQELVRELELRGVSPLGVGCAVISTWHPQENNVLEAIRDLGLDLHVAFNKGAVMVLPTGFNKGTGFQSALGELGLSPHNVLGFGDAENDHPFLRLCECSVAVANALESVKQRADIATQGDRATGMEEILKPLLANDLRD